MIQVPSQVRFGNQGIGWRLFVGGEYRIPHRSNIAPTPNSPKNPRSTCVFLLIRVVRTTWRGLGTYVSYTSTGYLWQLSDSVYEHTSTRARHVFQTNGVPIFRIVRAAVHGRRSTAVVVVVVDNPSATGIYLLCTFYVRQPHL